MITPACSHCKQCLLPGRSPGAVPGFLRPVDPAPPSLGPHPLGAAPLRSVPPTPPSTRTATLPPIPLCKLDRQLPGWDAQSLPARFHVEPAAVLVAGSRRPALPARRPASRLGRSESSREVSRGTRGGACRRLPPSCSPSSTGVRRFASPDELDVSCATAAFSTGGCPACSGTPDVSRGTCAMFHVKRSASGHRPIHEPREQDAEIRALGRRRRRQQRRVGQARGDVDLQDLHPARGVHHRVHP